MMGTILLKTRYYIEIKIIMNKNQNMTIIILLSLCKIFKWKIVKNNIIFSDWNKFEFESHNHKTITDKKGYFVTYYTK